MKVNVLECISIDPAKACLLSCAIPAKRQQENTTLLGVGDWRFASLMASFFPFSSKT
jgi:hypothetical protein